MTNELDRAIQLCKKCRFAEALPLLEELAGNEPQFLPRLITLPTRMIGVACRPLLAMPTCPAWGFTHTQHLSALKRTLRKWGLIKTDNRKQYAINRQRNPRYYKVS